MLSSSSSLRRPLVKVLGLAAAYAVTGKLGLLLAIPPGYATALWPPSGIALAAMLLLGNRYWPGVLLGSFFVNISTSFDASSTAQIAWSITIAASIGMGAALQALLGSFLIRRTLGEPLELLREWHVVQFLALGGPVSCLVNATIGVGTLAVAGLIEPSQLPFHWWTWWVGDTIGVAVVTPLVLVALGDPPSVWRRRAVPVAVPLGVMLALVTALFLWISAWERARIHAGFEARTKVMGDEMGEKLTQALETLHSLQSFYEASPEFKEAAFRAVVKRSLLRQVSLQALSWNPRVADADRSEFEKGGPQGADGACPITELDDAGNRVPAARRAEYVPIRYVEPHKPNAAALGFDVASEPARLEALRSAADSGGPVVTRRIRLVQETNAFGVLGFLPAYRNPNAADTPEKRRKELAGFFVGIFRLEEFFAPWREEAAKEGIEIEVSDNGAPADERLLWRSFKPGGAESKPRSTVVFESLMSLAAGGRVWSIAYRGSPVYVAANRSWRPWSVLAGGMLLAGFLGAFLLAATGRTVVIERLGADRARELSEANAVLGREIAERRRTEEALRESERRTALILATALDAVITSDVEGKITSWNQNAERIFGWAESEILGRRLSETIVPPAHREAHDRGLRHFISTGVARVVGRRIELTALRRSGEEFAIELAITPIRTDAGVNFSAFLRDITERKRAEKVLGESEERFRSTFEQAAVGIAHVSPDGRWLRVNQKLCDIVGYSRDELLQRTFQDLTFPDDLEIDMAHVREVLDGTIPTYAMEKRYRRKDGSLVWINLTVSLVRTPAGAPEYFISVIEDISRRKAAEERLDTTEARLLALSEADLIGVIVGDFSGIILEANDAFLRTVGYTRDDLVNGRVNWLEMTPSEHRGLDERAIVQLKATGVAPAWQKEFFRKDGSRVPVLLGVSLVKDAADTCVAFVLDLSERRMLEDQLRQAQKMEVIGRLAGGVAHDFNNLLTPIIGYSQMILDRLGPADRARDEIQEVLRAAERAASLTRQLLAFSRKQILQPKIVNLNIVVREVEKLLRRLIGEDVALDLKLAPDLGVTKVDPSQIDQVLMNLAVNARDAMPQGGTITIETAAIDLDAAFAGTHPEVAPGPYLLLMVSDTGTGMNQETLSHLFEPFFTTKEMGKGTGLGLATVHGIVRQSRGHIWVTSEVGRGTVFKMYFPVVLDPASVRPFADGAPPPGGGSEVILVVEDEPSLRMLACKVLESFGYKVLEAANGQDAFVISRVHAGAIDLLITDVVMPGMSGREVARQLRAARPRLKILYMSGYTENAIVHHGVLDEGTVLLEKPFTPNQLAGKAREILDGPDQGV